MSKRHLPHKQQQQQRPVVMKQQASPELKAWIIAQAQAGCRPEDVLKAMMDRGWQEDVAVAAMEESLAEHLKQQQGAMAAAGLAPGQLPAGDKPLPGPLLENSPSRIWAHDKHVDVLLTLQLPRVVVFGNFLSEQECEEMKRLADVRLARSETVVNETGGSEVNEARTSDGMFFERGEHEVCARIEKRIEALLRWPVSHGEGLQVLRYRPGAEYKPHYDYFDPAQPGAKTILSRGGQRVGTLVMYLNSPDKGGATTFPDVGLEVAPVRGNAVFFSYDRPDPATRTLHGGAPVLEGEKWVATKWLREGVFV